VSLAGELDGEHRPGRLARDDEHPFAYDITLEAGDALRRIRDAFADYDAS